jgi:hypothetical protein
MHMAADLISPLGEDARKTDEISITPLKQGRLFGVTPPHLARLEPADTDVYAPRIAYLTAVISGWAYANGKALAHQLPYYGMSDGGTVREFQVVNRALLVVAAAYFVRSRDGRVGILAFRGTVPNDFINWLTDANTVMRPAFGGFGQLHTGFYSNLEPLWSDVADTVDDAVSGRQGAAGSEPLQNLYITGHSLGAAMAVIAAARIFSDGFQDWQRLVRGVYTFGQPAVGDGAFGRHYEQRFNLYRHVYHQDVVPRMPPRSVGEFSHFGKEFLATDGKWQNADPPETELAHFLVTSVASAGIDYVSRRVVSFRGLRLPYSLEDHGPEGYIRTSRDSLG